MFVFKRFAYFILLPAVALTCTLVLVTLFWVTPLPEYLRATYVGRQSCIECHQEQVSLFTGSHHDCAMQEATQETVLASFENRWFEESGQKARFFQDAGKYFVETNDDKGELATYQIKWTFGLEPLQQYMVLSEGEAADKPSNITELGRVQVLRWSWDTNKKAWFHLDPPDVHGVLEPDDELAWTGPAQRWNNMCAACHSTNLQKGFDVASGRYHTTFNEIDVSCESCHGPASIHLELAKRTVYRKDPKYGHGLADLKSSSEAQIQSCAPCHSRRNVLAEGATAGDAYDDFFSVSLLTQSIYFDDGQVLEEDYVHGSFIQSKMYHKGIRCTDCHDPHTARLKHDGNQVCTSCHQHPTFKYDTPNHHFHKVGSAGASCVNCHMPTTTYMEVDARRDHSIRIPRPDLSVQIGTPNACTGCHLKLENIKESSRAGLTQYLDWMNAAKAGDKEIAAEIRRVDQWCDDACNEWYKDQRKRPYHFASALYAARTNPPQSDAVKLLQELLSKRGEEAPAIARATALQDLLRIDPSMAAVEAVSARDDPSPLVRAAAASASMGEVDLAKRYALIKPLLQDSSRSVRVEAARTAATTVPIVDAFREIYAKKALDDLKTSFKIDTDRSAGNFSLGILEQQLGNTQAAIRHYEDAIRIEPTMVGPRSNLAELLDELASGSSNYAPSQNLKVRAQQLRAEELPLLERDYGYAPENAAIAYRLGLAYYLNQNFEKAEALLKRAVEIEPTSTEYTLAYVLILEKQNKIEAAIQAAEDALRRSPDDIPLQQTLQRLTLGLRSGK